MAYKISNLKTLGVQEARVEKKWSSSQPEHRAFIRKSLAKVLNAPAVLDFNRISKWDTTFFSISHTTTCGGWVTSKSPIGIDLEPLNRVISPRVAQRITLANEEGLGLSPLQIWCAKEAAFKAVAAVSQIKTMTEINIRPLKKNIFSKTGQILLKFNKINSLHIFGEVTVFSSRDTLVAIAKLQA